ncbi:hypothetical protein M422DRAFT_58074 [Sphaerobolus stellatus SS14]|nr:hypothetical protein M422DRAFT_58074 [Sphaerobolus stellatus SS14]
MSQQTLLQKALILPVKQGDFQLVSISRPVPTKGEVLVKLHAIALNPSDWKIRKLGIVIQEYPTILGSDAAGTVEDVGEEVTQFKKGDRILYQGFWNVHQGTFQQYATVSAEVVAKIPPNLTFEQAATIPLGLATAAAGLYVSSSGYEVPSIDNKDSESRYKDQKLVFGGAGLRPPWEGGDGAYKGKAFVVLGGASSVGQYVIQLARLAGFSPIVSTASPHNETHLKSIGATHVIDRNAETLLEEIKVVLISVTGTPTANIVFDAVSAESSQLLGWKLLEDSGILVLVQPPHDGFKNILVTDHIAHEKNWVLAFGNPHINRDLGKVLYKHLEGLLESGKIVPNRVEIIPGGLNGIVPGLERMAEGKVSGVKLIVRPQETQ